MKNKSCFARSVLLISAMAVSPLLMASGSGGGGNSMPSNNFPSQTASRYDPAKEYAVGIEALRAADYKKARRAFKHVLTFDPRDANVNLMAGLAHAGIGEFREASRYYSKAIEYDVDLIIAYRELGVTWVKLGERNKANAVLMELEKRAVVCGDGCGLGADLRSAISTIEAALAARKSGEVLPVEELLPAVGVGDRSYSNAVSLINEGRYSDAIGALDKALLVLGPHPDVFTYIGYAYRKQKRYKMAEMYYRRALAIAPDHMGATEYYGEMMVERGELAEAKAMLAKLERICRYGCAEVDELRRWIIAAKPAS